MILTDQTILIKLIKIASKTASGIFIPDNVQQDSSYHSMKGVLVKKAPSAFVYNSARMAWKPEEIPEVGDTIIFARYEGTVIIGEDGEEYRILEDKTIQGFIKAKKGEK